MDDKENDFSLVRPASPLKKSWLDFLLDQPLLEKHLAEKYPDPSAEDLIIQFLANAAATTQSEQNNNQQQPGQPPVLIAIDGSEAPTGPLENEKESKRSLALKLLALKAAASLEWNLDFFEKKLPLPMQQTLITELKKAVNGSDLSDVEALSNPDAAFAYGLYYRWVIRTTIHCHYPSRGQKGITVQIPGQADPTHVPPDVFDSIMKKVHEECDLAADWLDNLLNHGTPVRFPRPKSFGILREEVKEPVHNWASGTVLEDGDVICQISFELGRFQFYKEDYPKALEAFERAFIVFTKVQEKILTQFDEVDLHGFYDACKGTLRDVPVSLHDQLATAVAENFKGVIPILLEDNKKREIPMPTREAVELEAQQKLSHTSEITVRISLCNCIRRVIDGNRFLSSTVTSLPGLDPMNLKFFCEALKSVIPDLNTPQKNSLKNFIRLIYYSSPDIGSALVSTKIIGLLLGSEKLEVSSEIPFQNLPVNESFSDDPAVRVGKFERALVSSHDPNEIIKLVQFLQKEGTTKPLASLNGQWELSRSLTGLLKVLSKNPQLQDETHVLLSKALELRALKLYPASNALFRAVELKLGSNFRLLPVIALEITHTSVLQAMENIPSLFQNSALRAEVAERARSCVLSYYKKKDLDISPTKELAEFCCVALLNMREWDVFEEIERQKGRNEVLELSLALSAVCKDICLNKFTRSLSQDLWELVTSMCTISQNKRTASGNVKENQRDKISGFSRVTYYWFLQKLKDSLALQVLIACLVKLYNILKDDSSMDVCLEYPALWPVVVSDSSMYDQRTTAELLQNTLHHSLSVHHCHAVCTKILADFCCAEGHHSAALKHYLTMIMISTDYFIQPPPKNLVDDLVFKRMAHCCSKLHCHTQAAVLTQFFDDPDYSSAFKSLNERLCEDSCDSLYPFIWDMTLLEFLVNLHARRGEVETKQMVLRLMGQLELNPNNNEEIQREAANLRKSQFLRALARQYM